MTAALRLVSSTPTPEPTTPQVRIVPDCRGAVWAVSPGTVFVLAGPPDVVGARLAAALAVYADRRPVLAVAP